MHYIHPVEPIESEYVYHDMKSLQSDRSNFGHKKGVKIFTLEKLYTRGANLHTKMYPCANIHDNRTDIFSRIARTDVRTYGRTSHTVHAITVASYRSCTKNVILTDMTSTAHLLCE